MAGIEDILAQMSGNPSDIRFDEACKVCEHYFGEHRQGVVTKYTRHREREIHG